MNWPVFTLCAMDCILFAFYRGSHFVMEFNDDYSNPVWWILMIFTAVINVIILNKITKKKKYFISVTSGIVAGTVICFIISMVYKTAHIFINVYWQGLGMYDGLSMDTIAYIAQTALYIYIYNIIHLIIYHYRKDPIKKLDIVIHNSGHEDVKQLEICLGSNYYVFDVIDIICPDEYIKKSIVLDDHALFEKLVYPYDIYLKYNSTEFRAANIFNNNMKLLYLNIVKQDNRFTVTAEPANSKAYKKAARKVNKRNLHKWHD